MAPGARPPLALFQDPLLPSLLASPQRSDVQDSLTGLSALLCSPAGLVSTTANAVVNDPTGDAAAAGGLDGAESTAGAGGEDGDEELEGDGGVDPGPGIRLPGMSALTSAFGEGCLRRQRQPRL